MKIYHAAIFHSKNLALKLAPQSGPLKTVTLADLIARSKIKTHFQQNWSKNESFYCFPIDVKALNLLLQKEDIPRW